MAIMSYDRVMYYVDLPTKENARHIAEAEVRTFW